MRLKDDSNIKNNNFIDEIMHLNTRNDCVLQKSYFLSNTITDIDSTSN